MITERMNFEELYRELKADEDELEDKMFTVHRMNVLKRASKKKPNTPVAFSFFVNTSRKNRYACILRVDSWKDFNKNRIHQFWMAIYNTSRGKYAVCIGHLNKVGKTADNVLRYQPHFFSRYAERMGLSLSGEDLMLHFLVRNNMFCFQPDPLNRNPQEVFIASQEGLSLGIRENFDVKCNTFIPYDGLGNTKYEISQKQVEFLKDMMISKYGSFIKTRDEMPFYSSHDLMMDIIERTLTDTDIRPSERNIRTFAEGDHRNAVFENILRQQVKKK